MTASDGHCHWVTSARAEEALEPTEKPRCLRTISGTQCLEFGGVQDFQSRTRNNKVRKPLRALVYGRSQDQIVRFLPIQRDFSERSGINCKVRRWQFGIRS